MIIKFKTRKNIYSSKQIVRYVLEIDKKGIDKAFDAPVLMRNIDHLEIEKIHKSFLANHKYVKKRKNGVAIFHEIIAVHKKDRTLTDVEIRDFMETYIRLRKAQNALTLAKSHDNGQHLHFVFSASEYKSSKALRMSKSQMENLLVDFESYHKERHPDLTFSIIHTKSPKRERRDIAEEQRNSRKEKEYQLKLRLGESRKTNKELVFEKVNALFDRVTSHDELIEKIQQEKDLQIYSYRSKLKGVILIGNSKTKYRFSTLGIDTNKILRLEKLQSRLEELKLVKEVYKSKTKIRSRGN
ncbi:MAG: hypothetical protein GKR88_15470 [Flavobacteriaceae bacterium]|nr:MAG: hypothetical protein GKR88_15470 [Flavobacteriaceae bacterium]